MWIGQLCVYVNTAWNRIIQVCKKSNIKHNKHKKQQNNHITKSTNTELTWNKIITKISELFP